MRSGHVGPGQPWRTWVCALFCALFPFGHLYAQATVVCTALDDTELFARIRGQTRDLAIHLKRAPKPAGQEPSAQQLRQLARAQSAEIVITIEQAPGGAHMLYIYDDRTEELRVRTAPAPARRDRFGRSAASETIALIVRGELSDALAGRASQIQAPPATTSPAPNNAAPAAGAGPPGKGAATLNETPERTPGKVRNDSAGESPPPHRAGSAATVARGREPSASEAANSEPEMLSPGRHHAALLGPLRLSLDVGARVSTPGKERYFVGPSLALRGQLGPVSFAVVGGASLPSRSTIEGLLLTLREYSVGLEGLGHVRLSSTLHVGLGGVGRWSFFRRNTAVSSGGSELSPEPTRVSSSLAFGLLVELRWAPWEHIGFTLRSGGDVLLQPLSLRYAQVTNPSVPAELERLRRWEPWLALGLVYTF